MASFLRRHSYRGGKSAAQLLGYLRAAPAAPIGLPPQTLAVMVGAHVQLLRSLHSSIATIQRRIIDLLAEHPRAQLLAALPGAGTINLAQLLGEVGPILDRASSAEQLVVAEHPEYRAVLDDPMSDELVEGANPRLHVALHLVIANQLWDDTPPEVWQAARRLLAQGHDRHEILHALAHELSHELYPVLTGQHAPDPDMTAYRARLRAL
jgi:Domain of unknown function (DUF1841)